MIFFGSEMNRSGRVGFRSDSYFMAVLFFSAFKRIAPVLGREGTGKGRQGIVSHGKGCFRHIEPILLQQNFGPGQADFSKIAECSGAKNLVKSAVELGMGKTHG